MSPTSRRERHGAPEGFRRRRGACPRRWSALSCHRLKFFAPIPRPPSPAGKGESFLLSFARGFAPCIPAAVPGGLLADGWVAGNTGGKTRRVPEPARYAVSRPAQLQGAGGEAPGRINLKSPPSPAGKGVGGMGKSGLAKSRNKPATPGTSPLPAPGGVPSPATGAG